MVLWMQEYREVAGLRRHAFETVTRAFGWWCPAVLIAAVLLAGCGKGGSGIFGPEPVTGLACPQVAILDGPDELIRFKGGGIGTITSVLFQAEMEIGEAFCELAPEKVVVGAELELRIALGPAETKREAKLAYFVAVLDPERRIILREYFPLVIKFEKNLRRIRFFESVGIQINKEKFEDPAAYTLYIGFEMTPAELEFAHRRKG